MSRLRASIVLFHTPAKELAHVETLLQQAGVVEALRLVDNGQGENRGYGKAHNIAIRESMEQAFTYHLVLNADLDFDPSVLKEMVAYMDAHPDVALLQPKIVYPDGTLQPLAKLLPSPMDVFGRRFLPKAWNKRRNDRFELRASGHNRIMNVPYLSGCFMLLRVSALEDVGLFDERFFMYPEDIDLTRRLHARYQTIFYPYVTIIHRHEQASYKNLRLLWIHITNMIRYFNKWGWIFDNERRRINRAVLQSISLHGEV